MSLSPAFSSSLGATLSRRTFLAATGAVVAAPLLTAGPASAAVTPLKSALVGLVDRNRVPSAGYVGAVPNVVIHARLADLCPTRGGQPVWDVIDSQLRAAKAAGVRGARLRVTTGRDAPTWLAAQVGTYQVTQSSGEAPITYHCPRWWTPAYTATHLAFDARLAARYNADPFIHEVQIWAVGSTYSAETAIREFSDKAVIAAAVAAGFTTARDVAHCYAFVSGMAAHWTTTRLTAWVPMAWQVLDHGKVHRDMAVSLAYAKHVRAAQRGAVIGIDNADQVAYARDPTYTMVGALGGPRADQTATWEKLGSSPANLLTTIRDATAAGVSSLELPWGYTHVTAGALRSAAAGMHAAR